MAISRFQCTASVTRVVGASMAVFVRFDLFRSLHRLDPPSVMTRFQVLVDVETPPPA
jgi:hypothetical protein